MLTGVGVCAGTSIGVSVGECIVVIYKSSLGDTFANIANVTSDSCLAISIGSVSNKAGKNRHTYTYPH